MPSSSSDSSSSGSDSDSEAKQGDKGDKADAVQLLDSDADSSESSESSDKKKARKEKKKKEKKKKKKKKDKAKKKDKKVKKKDKKDKKAKKAKAKDKKLKKANRDAVSNQFGKYGVIKPEDFFNKKPEFLLWAMEVRKENTDAMGQMQLKDLFKEYIEDYNTATMPSKKYYSLQAWDQQQSAKRHKRNRGDDMTEAQRAALASFDDERARREEIKNLQMKKQESQINDEVRRMRADREKVDNMKEQQRLIEQRNLLNKTGRTNEANKINERLR